RVLPAASGPAALLYAKRGDRQRPRMRRDDQADREHAVLAPAFDDIAGLDEDVAVARIFHLELVHVAGLAHLGAAARQRLLQREGGRPLRRGALDETERKAL